MINICLNLKILIFQKRKTKKIDPVEVYCRIKPITILDGDTEKCLKILDENNLALQIPEVSWDLVFYAMK